MVNVTVNADCWVTWITNPPVNDFYAALQMI